MPTTLASDRDGSGHFTEYVYDEAGRIIGVTTVVDESPPQIEAIDPVIVRRGPPVAMTILGSGLRQAQITTAHPGLTVGLSTSSASRVTFDLTADDSVPLGPQTLTVTTSLGVDSVDVEIFPQLPVIQTAPDLVVLEPGQQIDLALSIDRVDLIDHVFQLTSSDLNVAEISPAAVLIPAGQLAPAESITVSAVALGTTALRIETDEIVDRHLPAFVTAPWQVPPEGAEFYSSAVGVQVGVAPLPPRLVEFGPFTTRLGVVLDGPPDSPMRTVGPLASAELGLSLGSGLEALEPASVVRGSGPVQITALGSGLDTVASVAVIPPEDVTAVISAIAPDGSSLTMNITADAQAVLGLRRVELLDAGGDALAPTTSQSDRLRVTDPIPVVESVDPIYLPQGQSNIVLTVRGDLLGEVSQVRIEPPEGLIIGASPSIAVNGLSLTVNVGVAADAALGPRTVVVTSPAGDSDSAPGANNTVDVVSGIGGRVDPLVTATLGVDVGDGAPEPGLVRTLASAPVGLTSGGFIEGISPSAGSVGTTTTLTVAGRQLQAVTNIAFEPADGLTITDWVSAPDGLSLTIDVTIAADAPRSLRRLVLDSGSTELRPAAPEADRFRVAEQTPVVRSIDPILLSVGSGPTTVRVRGENLSDVLAVRLDPEGGAKVGAPVASPEGRWVDVDLTVLPDAQLGPRTIVVETISGQSSVAPSPANTIHFVPGIAAKVDPLIAPRVGVAVGSVPPAPPLNVDLTGSPVGVVVDQNVPPAVDEATMRSALLGVTQGSVVDAVSPRFLPVGMEHDLRIDGVGLAGADEVQFDPAEGISVITGPGFDAGNEQLTLRIAVDPATPQSVRRVRVFSLGEPVPIASAGADRVQLVGTEPVVTSIAPINAIPGETFALSIRGFNLFGVTAVTATPSTGLSIDANPQGSMDGREVIVNVTVAPDASPGLRVIRVQATAGLTTGDATSANTLRILGN